MSTTEQTLVPGNPPEWREFDVEDYDPAAAPNSDEDALGALLKERSECEDGPFGIVLVAGPTDTVPDSLRKVLAGGNIPTKVRREAREEHKTGKKDKKKSKDKD